MVEQVSLIIPCSFSHYPFIASAVASVELSELSPTQKIIVTDGFDPSIAVSRHLSELGYQIIRNQRACGPAGAKNTGLDFLSTDTEYIAFLDADDIMHPRRLSHSIRELKDRELSIVGTQSVIFSSSKCNLIDSSIAGHPQRPLDYEEIVARDAKDKVVMVYASMMIKREAQKTIGFFDENLERGEDYEYISRAIKLGIKVGNSPSKLYAYRHRKFDRYTQFKTDNSVRGVKNYLVLRFLLNCLYRGVSLPLEKGIKREWQDIFVRTSLLVDNHGLFKRFLERK